MNRDRDYRQALQQHSFGRLPLLSFSIGAAFLCLMVGESQSLAGQNKQNQGDNGHRVSRHYSQSGKKRQQSSNYRAKTVRPEVLRVYPHDSRAFTQGFLLHNGYWFESTGQFGASTLRKVERDSGRVVQQIRLSSNFFGEGLGRAQNELIQLTWKSGVARRYNLLDFRLVQEHRYSGEGWGLCFNGTRFVMSDGSSYLYFRNSTTFEKVGQVQVHDANGPVDRLNELECVGKLVYANVWQSNTIVRIDPKTGRLLTRIDASNLLSPHESSRAGVLNGIAYDSASEHFFVTGKHWPKIFEVRFPFEPDQIDSNEDLANSSVGHRGCATIQNTDGVLQAWLLGLVALSWQLIGRYGSLGIQFDKNRSSQTESRI